MPWPLSEATPALFSCSHSNLVFFHSPSFVDDSLLAVSPSSNPLTSLVFPSGPRYLCAACTCGQAISSARIGEDKGSPAESEL